VSGGGPRLIPPIYQRKDIIEEASQQTNMANGNALYEILRMHYYWNNMLADCLAIAASKLPK
jgi:hypothetical protein